MNKKLSVAFVAVLTLAVLATTMVGAVQAKQTKEPYYVEYGVMPIAPNTVDKNVGVCRIRSGSVMQGAYDGPVGVGTMTAELILKLDNSVTGMSVTTYKNTLVITSGPYGAFTLKGSTHFKSDANGFSGKTMLQGMSDFGPVTISAEKGFKSPPNPIWESGWISHP